MTTPALGKCKTCGAPTEPFAEFCPNHDACRRCQRARSQDAIDAGNNGLCLDCVSAAYDAGSEEELERRDADSK